MRPTGSLRRSSRYSLIGSYPVNPNEHTHNEYTSLNAKVSGTVDGGWGLRVTAVLKTQSGVPYGRFVSVQGCSASVPINCLNYGTQPVLVEPIGTRRQDTVGVFDYRVEKQIRRVGRARAGVFFDMFNTFNANTPVAIVWQSGPRFERASTVLGPRIVKFGAKFDW